jgi:hypothetical protein
MSRGSGPHLPAQGSYGTTTCPVVLYGLWVIEANKYPLRDICHHDLPSGQARIFQDAT